MLSAERKSEFTSAFSTQRSALQKTVASGSVPTSSIARRRDDSVGVIISS
jgi:hypothetical protein